MDVAKRWSFLSLFHPTLTFSRGEVESTFFWIAFLRGKEWDFGENERDINEGKFDEFYVKKEKIENSMFKISYDMLKKK